MTKHRSRRAIEEELSMVLANMESAKKRLDTKPDDLLAVLLNDRGEIKERQLLDELLECLGGVHD